MLDWKRVLRTAIQSACGAGIALVTAISTNFSRDAVIAALVSFGCTVVVAVLMNIKGQVDRQEREQADLRGEEYFTDYYSQAKDMVDGKGFVLMEEDYDDTKEGDE